MIKQMKLIILAYPNNTKSYQIFDLQYASRFLILDKSQSFMFNYFSSIINYFLVLMIELISSIQISINQRLDDIEVLIIDSDQFANLMKDDEKKRAIVKNFRIIKSSQKSRILEQSRCLNLISKLNKKLTKVEIMQSYNNQGHVKVWYLNTQYIARKNGDYRDIIEAFIFYYEKIKAINKVKQLIVIKNCNLFQQISFFPDNLGFLIANIQSSINYVYQNQKSKFFSLLKTQNRVLSPQKRQDQDEQQKFDHTGKITHQSKRKLQIYCFQLSKLLNLEHIYLDYFYFSSMDIQKRKKMLEANFTKRNIYINKIIQSYQKSYQIYKQKNKL